MTGSEGEDGEGAGTRTLLAVHLRVQGVVVNGGDGIVDLDHSQR